MFDCLTSEKLWIAQEEMSVPKHLIIQVHSLHCGQEATVRTDYEETQWFPTGKVVR